MSESRNTDDREPTLPAEYFEWLGRQREAKSVDGQILRANIISSAATASSLLKKFSETDGSLEKDDRELFAKAFKSVLMTHKLVQQGTSRIRPLQARGDDRCIVCYEHAADTLLLPCKHLVMCMVGLIYVLERYIFANACRGAIIR